MIEEHLFYSQVLDNKRFVRVYTPLKYHEEKSHYPVLYMHDGQNVFSDDTAIGGLSLGLEHYLNTAGHRLIVVAIDQSSSERKNEYCPWPNGFYSESFLIDPAESFGGKGDLYVEFIVKELKPHIDREYRTEKDWTAMAGISMGGLITVYAALKYPAVFKDITIFSSAFYANQEEIEKMAKITELSSINSFYMDCGTNEAGQKTSISKNFLCSNQSFYNVLKKKLPDTRFEVIENGEHHYAFFKKRVPKLFSFLQAPTNKKNRG